MTLRTLTSLSAAFVVGAATGAALFGGPAGLTLPQPEPNDAWFASRAAAVASYLLCWAALAGGLFMSSGWFDGLISRARLLSVHQWASLASVLFGAYHAFLLVRDPLADFTLPGILVPFLSSDRPAATGLGTLVLYLGLVVSLSFWLRPRIGAARWRTIHRASFLVYVGGLWHALQLGSDARNPAMLGLYLCTSGVVLVGVVVRLSYHRATVRRSPAGA